MSDRGAELLNAVYERPDDRAARAVLGDWLTEAGDPRGELIALQLAAGAPFSLAPGAQAEGDLDRAREKRVRSLFAKHWKTFVGPLAPHLARGGCVFGAGFLEACAMNETSGPKLAKLVGAPEWSTVRHLGLDSYMGAHAGALPLIRHPVMRALRSVSGFSGARMAELASGPPSPLEAVAFEWTTELDADTIARIAAAEALPKLRQVGLCARIWGRPENPVSELAPIFDGALFQRVERARIGYVGPLDVLVARMEALRQLRSLEVVFLWEIELSSEPSDVRMRFARGADGRLSELVVEWPGYTSALERWSIERFAAPLQRLPADALRALHVTVPSETEDLTPFEDATRRFAHAARRVERGAVPLRHALADPWAVPDRGTLTP